jgi:predicted small lipoprotein YifL
MKPRLVMVLTLILLAGCGQVGSRRFYDTSKRNQSLW